MIDNKEMRRELGNRIRAARQRDARRLRQRDIDDLVGVPHGRTAHYENGRAAAPINYLHKLSTVLGISIEWSMTGSAHSEPTIPAFPNISGWKEGDVSEISSVGGMDLRAYIAASNLQGLLSNPQWAENPSLLVARAVGLAEALIEELKK